MMKIMTSISYKIQNKEFPCVHEKANVGKGKVAKI